MGTFTNWISFLTGARVKNRDTPRLHPGLVEHNHLRAHVLHPPPRAGARHGLQPWDTSELACVGQGALTLWLMQHGRPNINLQVHQEPTAEAVGVGELTSLCLWRGAPAVLRLRCWPDLRLGHSCQMLLTGLGGRPRGDRSAAALMLSLGQWQQHQAPVLLGSGGCARAEAQGLGCQF